MTPRPWLAGLALALVLVGCGSRAPARGQPARSPAPTSRTPARTQPQQPASRPYAAAPTAPTAQAPRVVRNYAADPQFWRGSLDEARSDARTTGRLVFLEMGRDACGNCQTLKNKVIPDPSIVGPLKTLSVGFYDDIDRNRETTARNILQKNLPDALILPLAGWVTHDMRWISGFSGRRDANSFLQEIAKAKSIYGQRTEAERPVPRAELGAVEPVVQPSADGSLPAGEMADVTALLGEDAVVAAPVAETAAAQVPAPASGETAPESSAISAALSPEPPPVPVEVARVDPPAAVPPVPAPTKAAPPTAVEAPTADPVRAWAHAELERAAAALTARDYAAARTILAEVRAKAQGLPEQREAEKGEVAIRLLKKIERQDADEAKTTKADAAHDLRGTIWVSLFSA